MERAAESNLDILYSVVRVPNDIARTQSPRIVKLHGSLPCGPLIFTEEDFRTYPVKFAPFVNLARQVLLENVLCLVGFSADDPNFLEWSGWVRDQLGDSARPIYLVGCHDLSDTRRKYLESRKITAIDLSPIIDSDADEDNRHLQAMDNFLDYLERGRPKESEWKVDMASYGEIKEELPKADAEARLIRLIEVWSKQRNSYPGWLVAPQQVRQRLRLNLDTSFTSDLLPDEVSITTIIKVLYEAVWRWELAFQPLPFDVENTVVEIISRYENEELLTLSIDQRIHIRATILRVTRRKRNWKQFDERIQFLINLDHKDADVEALYERCLKARDELDYKFISDNLNKLTGNDPVWLLRQGALAIETLDLNSAAVYIKQAFREIQLRRSKDRHSIWLLSREAWACMLLRGLNFTTNIQLDSPQWLPEYKEKQVDSFEEIRHLERQIEEIEREQQKSAQELIPHFDAGAYSIPGRKIYFSSPALPLDEISSLTEHVGIPLCVGDYSLLSTQYERASQIYEGKNVQVLWSTIRSIVTANQPIKQTDKRFNRLAVVRLSEETASDITEKIQNGIEFILKTAQQERSPSNNSYHMQRLYNLIELLSRIAVIAQGDKAIELYRFGKYLYSNMGNSNRAPWDSINHLLRRSLEAIEPCKRAEIGFDVIDLPLLNKNVAYNTLRSRFEIFDQLGQESWIEMKKSNRWSSIIKKLIEAATQETETAPLRDVVYRLYRIYIAGALTEPEVTDYREAVKFHVDKKGFSSGDPFFIRVFLRITNQNNTHAKDVFEAAVVKELVKGNFSEDRLECLAWTSLKLDNQSIPFTLSSDDAKAILIQALNWKPKEPIFTLGRWEDPYIANIWLGCAIADKVLPSLDTETIQDVDITVLLDRISDEVVPSFMMALPELVRLKKIPCEHAVNIIQEKLIRNDEEVVRAALLAIHRFRDISNDYDIEMPLELIEDIISICVIQREPGLKQSLEILCSIINASETNFVLERNWKKLTLSLCMFAKQMDYESDLTDLKLLDFGLIRRNALKLAFALKEAGIELPAELDQWIVDSASDPLPEVRYALYNEN